MVSSVKGFVSSVWVLISSIGLSSSIFTSNGFLPWTSPDAIFLTKLSYGFFLSGLVEDISSGFSSSFISSVGIIFCSLDNSSFCFSSSFIGSFIFISSIGCSSSFSFSKSFLTGIFVLNFSSLFKSWVISGSISFLFLFSSIFSSVFSPSFCSLGIVL